MVAGDWHLPGSWLRIKADRLGANRPPVGRGGAGHRLPALVIDRQHVITHQGFTQGCLKVPKICNLEEVC